MEKSILFNTLMVQAIQEDRKGSTRRIVKPQPTVDLIAEYQVKIPVNKGNISSVQYLTLQSFANKKSPYQVGDILWVRETWKIDCSFDDADLGFWFSYTDGNTTNYGDFTRDRFNKFKKFAFKNGWQPALFMPREAARIFLKVTSVNVERLQDTTEDEAKKEGVSYEMAMESNNWGPSFNDPDSGGYPDYLEAFKYLWDSIHKNWNENPYVWVVEFERVKED